MYTFVGSIIGVGVRQLDNGNQAMTWILDNIIFIWLCNQAHLKNVFHTIKFQQAQVKNVLDNNTVILT